MTTGPDPALRALLFGDVPIDRWPNGDAPTGEPWGGFVRARVVVCSDDLTMDEAVEGVGAFLEKRPARWEDR